MDAYFDSMRRYVEFHGRSSPRQYWLFMIVLLVALLAAVFADGVAGQTDPGIVTTLVGLAHIVPAWAVTARRLHDTGRSGWWALFSLVPVVGAVVVIVMCCGPSQPSSNQYGQTVAANDFAFHRDSYRQVHLPVGVSASPPPSTQPSAGSYAGALQAAKPQLSESTKIKRLETLARLRAAGTVDEGEFESLKAQLLGSSQARSNAS